MIWSLKGSRKSWWTYVHSRPVTMAVDRQGRVRRLLAWICSYGAKSKRAKKECVIISIHDSSYFAAGRR